MLKRLYERLALRKREREYQEFLTGYGWAWAAYMLEEMHVDDIEALAWPGSDPFDQGAHQALLDIAAWPEASTARQRRMPFKPFICKKEA